MRTIITYNGADNFEAKDILYWISVLNFRSQYAGKMLLMTKAVCVCLAELFINYTMNLSNCGNFGICSLPKATSNAFDKAYLATMKCVVVSKAFKTVADEGTKFKQIKRQLKALGFDNEYAGQKADALNNA